MLDRKIELYKQDYEQFCSKSSTEAVNEAVAVTIWLTTPTRSTANTTRANVAQFGDSVCRQVTWLL